MYHILSLHDFIVSIYQCPMLLGGFLDMGVDSAFVSCFSMVSGVILAHLARFFSKRWAYLCNIWEHGVIQAYPIFAHSNLAERLCKFVIVCDLH